MPNASQLIEHAQAANARGDFASAAALCRQALQDAADAALAWFHLGIALRGQGKRSAAINAFENARMRTFDSAEAQYSIGLQFSETGADATAEKCLKRSLALSPGHPIVSSNLARLYLRQHRYADAAASLTQAIDRQPQVALLHVNLANVLVAQGRYEDAQAACRRAIAIDASLCSAWINLADALCRLRAFEEARQAAQRAVDLDPSSALAWRNLGCALFGLHRHADAARASGRALELDDRSATAWDNLGSTCFELGRYAEAADYHTRCLQLDERAEFVVGKRLRARMRICDWRTYDADVSVLGRAAARRERAAHPFIALGVISDPALLRATAEIWASAEPPVAELPMPIGAAARHGRIRIGYFSADFHNHATAYLMARMFELHDRSRFEIYAFSFGPQRDDEMRRRLVAAFDHFVDVRDRSDRAVAELARELEIDIAVDLKGYTKDNRSAIFAYRAAPIQVNYLGYPGTMGVGHFDYVLADATVIPREHGAHYSEAIVRLPDSYQVTDAQRAIAPEMPSRKELGLPEKAFVFCCFNNSYKIVPSTFDGWMRILARVDRAVLWLYQDHPDAAKNLAASAMVRGIDPARLIFAPPLPQDEHLARLRAADLFLDTLPYNAHTTASDALWAGLPVLTCLGASFAGRVAASVLRAIDLPELITTTPSEYEELAVALAHDAGRLAELRDKLEHNRVHGALFDTARFTAHIETAFETMVARQRAHLPPADFDVVPPAAPTAVAG